MDPLGLGYMDSPQWKSYLYLFPEIEAVRYDVFKVDLRRWRMLFVEEHGIRPPSARQEWRAKSSQCSTGGPT